MTTQISYTRAHGGFGSNTVYDPPGYFIQSAPAVTTDETSVDLVAAGVAPPTTLELLGISLAVIEIQSGSAVELIEARVVDNTSFHSPEIGYHAGSVTDPFALPLLPTVCAYCLSDDGGVVARTAVSDDSISISVHRSKASGFGASPRPVDTLEVAGGQLVRLRCRPTRIVRSTCGWIRATWGN